MPVTLKRVHSTAIVFLISCSIPSRLPAQSFYGTTGLIKTPTAEVAECGTAAIGGGYAADHLGQSTMISRDWSLFATIGLAPRLEAGLRLAYGRLLLKSTTDRMLNVKCLLTRESRFVPATALGGQDIIGGCRNFNSLYVVSSKNLGFLGIDRIRIHLGWGTDWWDFILGKASGHRFIGPFGGIEARVVPFLGLLAEYDADDINLGARLSVKRILNVTVNLVAMKKLGCVASLVFSI